MRRIARGSMYVVMAVAGNSAAAQAQSGTNLEACRTYFLTPSAMSWPDAQAFARRVGGNLATVRNATEQAYLNGLFLTGATANEAFWIGFHRTTPDGPFAWQTGDPPTYTNFNPGEPNNACGGEPAAVMNWYINQNLGGTPGQWNDTPDNGTDAACTNAGARPYRGIVEVAGHVAVSRPPQDAAVCPGGARSFMVEAVGIGPFVYRWEYQPVGADFWIPLHDGVFGARGNVDGSQTEMLRLSAILPTDAGLYRAIVTTVTDPCGPSEVTGPAAMLTVSCFTVADVASLGGATECDGALTADDVMAFLAAFFANDLEVADVARLGGAAGRDGQLTADDVVLFLSAFFAGCV
ncbi:MAG: GC-type dockerin domain-anchored protein [Phycisphaerales bacterium]